MASACESLAARWRATDCAPRPNPHAEAATRRLEEAYGITLPDDFRAYLIQGAPGPDEELWDDEHTTWWAVERIKNIPDEYQLPIDDPQIARKAGSYLFFADHMIWCWAWAICCSDGEDRGKVAVIGRSPDRIVANSFSEFVNCYLSDAYSVF